MADNRTGRAESGFDLGELIQKLFQDLSRLVRNEAQLLKVELEEDVSKLLRGSLLLAVGLGFGFFAFGVLTVTLIVLLNWGFENLFWSTLVVGMAYLLICLILVSIGKSKARQATPVLDESLRELQRSQEAIGKEL